MDKLKLIGVYILSKVQNLLYLLISIMVLTIIANINGIAIATIFFLILVLGIIEITKITAKKLLRKLKVKYVRLTILALVAGIMFIVNINPRFKMLMLIVLSVIGLISLIKYIIKILKKFTMKVFTLIFASESNSNAMIKRSYLGLTKPVLNMINNDDINSKSNKEKKNILKRDYKEMLYKGVKRYPEGISITTHEFIVKGLIRDGIGTEEEYNKCRRKKKSIVKEKFHIMSFKAFISNLKGLSFDINSNEYKKAKKILRSTYKYKFIIKLDNEGQWIIKSST